jgi:lipoprotein-anchoring transpeptidase ErfK/SrfK
MKQVCIGTAVLLVLSTPAFAASLDAESVNKAVIEKGAGKEDRAAAMKAQILLDRQRYSPGVIDGHFGDATEIALRAFQKDNGLKDTGKLDKASWDKLSEAAEGEVLTRYTITADDLKGPFVEKIPEDIEEMGKLDSLAYSGPTEALSERFHMDEDALKALNPKADFSKEGTEIVVAAVEPENAEKPDKENVERIVVDKSERTLRVLAKDGTLIALYPASIGSKENPAPDGEVKVTSVADKPTWTYSPDLKLEGKKDRPDKKVVVPAGPNNPVGVTWIDLDKEHFGLHGSPEPEKVGKEMSSGCVRLTNWDIKELAGMVKKGLPVVFED